jgi:hypothetical protein
MAKIKLTAAERELIADHMREIVETMQDEYGPDEQRAVALASSVLDKLHG